VTGTAKERESLESLPWSNKQVEDWTGRLTVEELMGGLGHAGLCVAASTGPLHLASALGTPVVGLFGGEAPFWPERWRPLGPRVKVVVAEGVEEGSGLALSTAEIIAAIEKLTATDAGRRDR
jgi:ADP-heptose:LPS heptosyltransferase